MPLVLLLGGRGGVFSATLTRPSCNMDRGVKGSRGGPPGNEYQSGIANVLFANFSTKRGGGSGGLRGAPSHVNAGYAKLVTYTFSEPGSPQLDAWRDDPACTSVNSPLQKKKKLFVTVPDDHHRLVHGCARSAQPMCV